MIIGLAFKLFACQLIQESNMLNMNGNNNRFSPTLMLMAGIVLVW